MQTQVMTQAGTPYWSAPEVLRGEIYNESADVYSFAMVCFEIWARDVPFKGMSPMEASVQVTTANDAGVFLRPDLEGLAKKVGKECPIIDLVERSWDDDWKNRPTFSQICDAIEKLGSAKGWALRTNRTGHEEIEFDW